MSTLPPGTDRYQPLTMLGEGGMGTVWRAEDRQLSRLVALKVPKGGPASGAAERLRREGDVLTRLDHPGIVAALDRGALPDGRPFLVLRIVPGPPLDAWAEQRAPGPVQRAWTLRGAIAAVAHAHARGVVHRDLKPSNIRVADDGTVCVLDWGLARILTEDQPAARAGAGLTRVGSRIGTPAYMSPEQAAGEEVGPEADVWALGVLLWELLAGRRAYAGRAATEVLAGVLSGPPTPLAEAAPHAPAALAAVAELALSPLDARPRAAGDLLAALDAALAAMSRPTGGDRGRARWGWLAGAALLGLGIGAAGAALAPATAPVDANDPALIEALLEAGDREAAEAAACARLARHPDDAVARGALLAAVPPLSPVWHGPAPPCAIGAELRWDGRALACADGQGFALYTLDDRGIHEAWRREEEVHRVVFTGLDSLLAQAPRRPYPLRRRVADGSVVDLSSAHLRGSRLEESRSPEVGRGTVGREALRERWLTGGTAPARGVGSDAVRWTPDVPVRQVIVLSDGAELQLEANAVVRTGSDGRTAEARFPLPPEVGPAARMAASTPERHVVVLTETGQAAVLELPTGEWSPWADVGLRGARSLAVSPDGRTAAGTLHGRGRVWSVHAPGIARTAGRDMTRVAFPDARHVAMVGTHSAGLWSLSGDEDDSLLHLGEPVSGLAWDELGLLAWGRGAARLRGPDGTVRELAPPLHAAAAPDGAGLALARGDGGVEVLSPDGPRTIREPCGLVAWTGPDRLACATSGDGPVLVDPATGAVDRSHALPRQRWIGMDARDGVLALMDWDTRIYELAGDTLVHRTTASWANRAILARGGAALLLNGRRALVRRAWRTAAEDTPLVPTRFRADHIAVDPAGDRVAVALPTGGFRVDPIAGGAPAIIAGAGRDRYTSLAWSPDGTELAAGGSDGLVRIFDLDAEGCGIGTAARPGDTPTR